MGEEENIKDGHMNKYSMDLHSKSLRHPQHLMDRQMTPSEIEAFHHTLSTNNLNIGRKEILNDRIAKRRYVWKDAKDVDIACLIASPCVKPNTLSMASMTTPHKLQSSRSQKSVLNITNTHRIFQKPKSMMDVLLDEDEFDGLGDEEFGATLDDEKQSETESKIKKKKKKKSGKKGKNMK